MNVDRRDTIAATSPPAWKLPISWIVGAMTAAKFGLSEDDLIYGAAPHCAFRPLVMPQGSSGGSDKARPHRQIAAPAHIKRELR